jgi:ParB-like chromosome segregation protein Spo0J
MSTSIASRERTTAARPIAADRIDPNPFSLTVYGESSAETESLIDSIRDEGILVPLVVAPEGDRWQVISGHRRLACARALGFESVPCEIRPIPPGAARNRAVLDYNRQRSKTFSQRMREADALQVLVTEQARRRRRANLRRGEFAEKPASPDRRNSDDQTGRTDAVVARAVGLGGKDLYRQARAVWEAARLDDPRALAAVAALDAGIKTVHAAYKDLRRRDRFSADFRPTPYDVWSFRHDDAFGVPHPGAIPAGIVAHAVFYFSPPGGLVVDPMAGGGTSLDVCRSMGRRCLAYDLHPARPEIGALDVRAGLPPETHGCDLIFCDPPYHTMRARRYAGSGVGEAPLADWIAFLQDISRLAFLQLRPGGHVALLLANQTEKDLPAGQGYLDHVFLGYSALLFAGFLPVRRISCPMSGGYRPQQVRRAREEGRLLGLVRDLIVMRKPLPESTLGAYQSIPKAPGSESGSPPTSS